MIIHDMPQYSDEWWAIRTGIPTASGANKLLTPTGKLSAQSDGYLNELLAERAGFGDPPMEPTEWMLRGLELEPEARAYFELETGLMVREVGFITDDDKRAGCSPDGMVADPLMYLPTGLEIKCPKASTHFSYLRAGVLPPYYAPQVHFSMAITGATGWYFLSYFPGLEPLLLLVEPDDYTAKVAAAITEFTERLETEAARFGL